MRHEHLVGACILILLMGTAMSATAESASLSRYQWKNRVLVIAAPSLQDRDLLAQRRLFAAASKGMAERDLVLIEAAGDDAGARALRRQLSIGEKTFQVLLVGKDGNPAASSERPWSSNELFAKIDAMPMRRDEMRHRR